MDTLRHLSQEWIDKFTQERLIGYACTSARSLPRSMRAWSLDRVPLIRWLPNYDCHWVIGDVIAGLTVGLMLVPQSIAYAGIATLPVQYGLFSSYIAPILYTFTGTSKDLTIGPTAVVSLLTGDVIQQLPDDNPVTVAIATAYMVGICAVAVGVLQLGIILDFIPGGVLTGYTSGAGLIIAIQQLPKLLGEYDVNTRNKTATVLHDSFVSLYSAHWRDMLFALLSMISLLSLQTLGRRHGSKNKILWFIGVARNTLVVTGSTAISYGLNKHHTQASASISIIGNVPSGLASPAAPELSLLPGLAAKSFTIFLAAILEHMAIGKAFARRDKYQIDQNQELFSIGLVNIVGSFFGAFTVTGSFSRTAVNNASGSKSPLSGLMCAAIVVVSVSAVTPAFYYISNATLSAVILLAVIQLVAGPRTWYQLWRLSFWDFLGGMLAFWVTLFVSVEVGIYASVGYSLIVLLWRVARPSVRLLAEVTEDPLTGELLDGVYVDARDQAFQNRGIQPLPGVLVIRLEESLTFPNSRYIKNQIMEQVFAYTKGGENRSIKKNWNYKQDELIEGVRERYGTFEQPSQLSTLRGVILDFSAVNNLDSTGLQTLFDLRCDLQDFAGSSSPFELHFVCVHQSVLRLMRLADVANPPYNPDRPLRRTDKSILLTHGYLHPKKLLAKGEYDRLLNSSSGSSASYSAQDKRSGTFWAKTRSEECEAEDNCFQGIDPVPSESDGMGPILDPAQALSDGLHGLTAFLDPENDKFLIHLSIKQAINVLGQRLHLSEQRALEIQIGQNNSTKDLTSRGQNSADQATLNDALRNSPVYAQISSAEPPIELKSDVHTLSDD